MPGVKGRSGGSNRKPTRVLRLEGGYREDRHGGSEPEPDGLPVKPKTWGKRSWESRCWDRMTPWMFECGVVTAADQTMLEMMCGWYSEYRKAAEAGNFTKMEKAFKLFDSIASRFGCTPSDRARLRIEAPKTSVQNRVMSCNFLGLND